MKQMTKIMGEVNYDLSTVKLVKCLAAHNEEEWIEFNLRNNYDEFDIIRVVEGAVENRPNSTPDGHSTDRTLELIKNFPDPDNKIELYTLGRPFKSLEEQKQIFLDAASPGEWLFIVDCDEFYKEGDVARIRKAIEMAPLASEFIPTFLHFYRDFWHIRDFTPEWNIFHQRIIRFQPGMRYHSHPVATDARGICTCLSSEYQPLRFSIPGLYIYHYGHAKGKRFHEMKREFYMKELAKFSADGGKTAAQAFDEKFLEFVNYSEGLHTVLKFTGEHPEAIKSHPAYSHRDEHYVTNDNAIQVWNTVGAYAEKQLPNIPAWMYGKFQKFVPYYNVMRV
jgi:hypothetical protein